MFQDKRNLIIRSHIAANHSKIKVITGKCRYNYQCNANAVHDALVKNHSKIAMVVYFTGKGHPIIHFINHTAKGNFKDNTLGVWSSKYQYYFIRWIEEKEFDDVFKIHDSMRVKIKSFLPWYLRLFAKLVDH